MNNRMVVMIVLSIVMLLGLLIQTARLPYFETFSRNNDWAELNDHFQTVDSISTGEIGHLAPEQFLILYEEGWENRILAGNIVKVMDYMKKSYTLRNVRSDSGDYQNYQAVIITFEDLDSYPNLQRLLSYVAQGGAAFFARSLKPNQAFLRISTTLGVDGYYGTAIGDGIKLVSNVVIGAKGYRVTDDFIYNSFLALSIKPGCTLHATALDGTPLLWEAPYKAGKFIVFNGTMLKTRMTRGLIAGALSMTQADFLYPVYNIKLCYIDDFPSQIPNRYVKNIAQGYGRSFNGFYREVWWPQMLQIANRYGLKYSEAVIETYNDKTKPPFKELFPPGVAGLKIYGREILKNGGEIGLHGYNHQPLVEPGFLTEEIGYKPWLSQENMIAAVREANRYIRSVFPNYKVLFYVPPSNILSVKGREALRKAMPELRIISSHYGYSEIADEGGALIQEFGVGPDGIVDLPRLTYDYANNQLNNWAGFNGVASIGIYSHYVHPDDVADPERSFGKTWEEMARDFDKIQKSFHDRYPWLRSMTASEAGAVVAKYASCKVYLERSNKGIVVRCNGFPKEFYFILRSQKKVSVPQGCTATRIDVGVYLIRATLPAFLIGLK
jgi:hypothetical protein